MSSTPEPFLAPGTAATGVSSSARWQAILQAEQLSLTAPADSITTPVGTQQLGNLSLSSGKIDGAVFASDGNYPYFLQTFPDNSAGKWNAAWMGDGGGCE